MGKITTSIKNFYAKNEKKILLGAVSVATIATTVALVEHRGLVQHDDFLKDKGLYNELYDLSETNADQIIAE